MSEFTLAQLIWLLAMVPLTGLFIGLYFAIGAPLRRQERARFFLDLIDTGLREGQSAEQTIVSIARTGDRSVGVQFHLLAAHVESGWRLAPSLQRVKGFLPPQIMAMLAVGDELGDLAKVLPACRIQLRDAASRTQGAYNYLILLVFVLLPVFPALFWALTEFIFPRLLLVFAEALEVGPDASGLEWMRTGVMLAKFQLVLAAFFYMAAVVYIGGPRMVSWIESGLSFSVADHIAWWLPWRLKRMRRDFSAMLAILLDAQAPEARAVQLAAESTANSVFVRRAEKIVRQLRRGVSLGEAISLLDHSGEFQWRLRNALHSENRFFAALRGWFESLDAKAYQEEQAFAHLLTTLVVLFNGAMVAMFTLFVFRGLTLIIDTAVLW